MNVRSDFPALKQNIHGKPVVYLDTAATSLKPQAVIDRVNLFYSLENANVHRGAHQMSQIATQNYEDARAAVAKFIGADTDEIIFVRNTTEGINLVAHSFAENNLQSEDQILLTELEHHGNIVPWQLVAAKKNLKIQVVPITADNILNEDILNEKLKGPVKLFAFTACSNALGVLTDAESYCKKAKAQGIYTLIDAAQLVSQKKIDVRKLDCDFLVFSAHKIFGPTGIGVLYVRKNLLSMMPPYQGGGSMIKEVKFSGTTFQDGPLKFEAGTPHIAGAIGLHSALDYFSGLDLQQVQDHEHALMKKAYAGLKEIKSAKIYTPFEKTNCAPILSFNLGKFHSSDVATILDQQGVEVRAGHHCNQPLMSAMKVSGTVRASFSIYNNSDDVERFLTAVQKAESFLL